jgi:hypothetical protein
LSAAELNSIVCVVCHDAGGAEILASYVAEKRLHCRFVLEGPAVLVFERHLGRVERTPLTEAVAQCDWCLLGTSWQSDLEWRAIEAARQTGKRSVSFLDHWVSYAERFERGGVRRLPDEIWVGDGDAHALAAREFPGLPVTTVANPYFAYAAREIARYSSDVTAKLKESARVLFVSENLSGHARLRFGDERHWGYTEFDAIDYLFRRVGDLGEIERVVLRPHPSDPPNKYAQVIAANAPLAEASRGRPLLEEIAAADIVAGCESVALVAAQYAGKRVLCAIPPGGRVQFMDRRRGVEMLRDLGATGRAGS